MSEDIKSKEYWRDKLSPEEFHVCREQGTERAFTGEYWNHKEQGQYLCRCCGEPLFESESKFDSGCGWPSFTQPAERQAVEEQMDRSHGMVRTEVHCRKCASHLGHVFTDGPAPKGLRYCINSLSIRFKEDD
ncbi:MAG: peptide-methionine (R)-S-oxide reductase MsrB [Cellvibrionaceae bacterium]|nr:peptide-methionine (R)-S-oxide reductase MsrB [Cellvibrionaceae bacterium]